MTPGARVGLGCGVASILAFGAFVHLGLFCLLAPCDGFLRIQAEAVGPPAETECVVEIYDADDESLQELLDSSPLQQGEAAFVIGPWRQHQARVFCPGWEPSVPMEVDGKGSRTFVLGKVPLSLLSQ
ncbi:MAG: hypothetical protein K0U98_08650 [Deltaproteobacteria bacterium]|nr:hypothetical protein [Deltaproteobacteria bacterium]